MSTVLPAGPGSLQGNPKLDQWLRFSGDGFIDVLSGKVEIGQGILSALAQIVADELDLPIDRLRMMAANTELSPNEGVTSGSLSIQDSGSALRHACALARAHYLEAAALRLGVPATTLRIDSGNIIAEDGQQTSYWSLVEAGPADLAVTADYPVKSAADYRWVGRSVPRTDLPERIFGQPCFIHDLELPKMVHGRILRPPSPSATLSSIDVEEARASAGVIKVVRDGSLVGVLADSARNADSAVVKLARHAHWHETESLPDENTLASWLKSQSADSRVVEVKSMVDGSSAPEVDRTVRANYSRPFIAHASIAPSCALGRIDGDRLEIWSHSQSIFNLRKDLALALAMEERQIVVQHVAGAGCYGHNGADDVAFDAAWLARAAAGRPVRVQWSRADELAWAPLGPAMAVALEADLDDTGAVVGWRHEVWSNGHSTRPGRAATPALLGSWHQAQAFAPLLAVNVPAAAGGGAERNAIPLYDFPSWQVNNHRVLTMPLRTSALRSLGACANVFAIESFIDELAHATGANPIEFRLRYLQDRRGRAVLDRVVEMSGWQAWHGREGVGHGIGFARYKNSGAYCAVVAEIEVEREVRVSRLVISADVGLVINPDGVANQLEGGAIQATSWTLKEAVRFDHKRVTSDSWESYPILRFSEIPAVLIDLVPSTEASVGAGEASLGPTAAAIANALFDALGVRMRDLPLSAERIAALLLASD